MADSHMWKMRPFGPRSSLSKLPIDERTLAISDSIPDNSLPLPLPRPASLPALHADAGVEFSVSDFSSCFEMRPVARV